MKKTFTLLFLIMFFGTEESAQTSTYRMPEENGLHEGTWLQWPHNYLYGPYYRDDVESTWISMTNALQSGERVHIVVYDAVEQTHVVSVLTNASVPLGNIDFYIHQTDDVWIRDNGPMFVYDQQDSLKILDWGFNGWGGDTPFSKCDIIPQSISTDLGLPLIDLSAMVLEGGAIEHDGNGTMMATKSSVTHASRNPGLTEVQIENYLTDNMGITNFIWLDGVYGQEITDMHIDGVMKFANDSTIVTMNNADLLYWGLTQADIDTLYAAKNKLDVPYNFIYIPLTQNNVVTTYGNNLGYKGSYANYYIANDVVLVPTYNDPNDAVAIGIIQGIYPNRNVVGIDVRNIYEYGGMVHCITQQQPVNNYPLGMITINENNCTLGQNIPNPFNDESTIDFFIPNKASVSLDMYNSLGQKVESLFNSSAFQGEKRIRCNATKYEKGIYFYTLTVNNQIVLSRKMIVEK